MKLNIAILVAIALLTYAITYFLSSNNTHQRMINEVPDANAVQESLDQNAQQIPEFAFTDLNGKKYQSTHFKDKIIVLNFWASWCAPCVKEFPNLLKIAATYPDDLAFIALSSDLNEEAIHKFMHKMQTLHDMDFSGENVYIALDNPDAPVAQQFQSFKLPETYIITRGQSIHHKFIGADWDFEDMNTVIQDIK